MAIVYCSWATGDDTTGTGTAANPYKTITKASTSRTAGDEVRVAKSPDPTALTGTTAWTLNGTTVTGTGTLFTTELAIGDFIKAPDGGWYEVITLTSDTSATLYKVYPSATQSGFSSSKLGVTNTGAGANYAAVQTVSSSGNESAYLYISGGWDLSTETQTGQTWFRQMHGTFANRYGFGLYLNAKNFVHISGMNFLRYQYGIYVNAANNNTFISPVCLSSNPSGFYFNYARNNTFVSAVSNSNNTNGVELSQGSNNNTFVSLVCKSNGASGVQISYSGNNYFKTSLVCSYNTTCGVGLNRASVNLIDSLSTEGNGVAIRHEYTPMTHISNGDIAESSVVSFLYDYGDDRACFNNSSGYSYVYSDYAAANSQDATAGGTGKEWKLAITDAKRYSGYPFYIPIARVAVASSGKVTVKVYFKKSGTGIAGGLRCRVNQVAWSDGTSDITVTCPDNTSRNQVTLEFTPTEAGVVEIEAGAWHVSSTSQTVIIDDIEITQA